MRRGQVQVLRLAPYLSRSRSPFHFPAAGRIIRMGGSVMRPLDVPEILIAIGLAASIAWAVYIWRHRHLDIHK
jgi:hypothetical protein